MFVRGSPDAAAVVGSSEFLGSCCGVLGHDLFGVFCYDLHVAVFCGGYNQVVLGEMVVCLSVQSSWCSVLCSVLDSSRGVGCTPYKCRFDAGV